MRITAVMNQKGGVGKTTTAVNLAAILAVEHGRRVLAVDVDPQGNLSEHFGLDPNELEASVYDVIMGDARPEGVARECHGATVLPSNIDLAGAEVELASMTVRETRLRSALRDYCQGFDAVILDCPPGLGLLTLSALCLAGDVLVPMEAEYLAMRGLGQLAHTVERIREGINPALAIGGIVFCRFDTRTRLSQEVRHEVATHFEGRVFRTAIRRNVRLAEASSHGRPVIGYDPECAGAQDYRALALEYLRRGGEAVSRPEPAVVIEPDPPHAGEGGHPLPPEATYVD
jgi:chromosome partitioning protein